MSYDLDGIRRTSEDKVSRQKEQKHLQLDIRELVKNTGEWGNEIKENEAEQDNIGLQTVIGKLGFILNLIGAAGALSQ